MTSPALLLLLAALPADPQAALAQVDAAAARLENVRFAAVRTSVQGGVTQEERWAYAAEAGGHFRVNYVGDTDRRVACDGKILLDYVPALHAAQRVDLYALSEEDRTKVLSGVLQKVSLPGIRTGIDAAKMRSFAWGPDGQVDGRATRAVIATDDRGGQLSFVLDAERGTLVSSEVRDNGVFVVSTEGHDFREVQPGLWLPMRVTSTAPAPGGKVAVELDLLQVVVGQDLPDDLFSLQLDPTVQVRNVP